MHALMYMVRHTTQLPVTTRAIAKAEGIPYRQLVNLFGLLEEAGIIRKAEHSEPGYVFKKSPSEVTLLEIFETIEGGPIFNECFLDYCDCQAKPTDCEIYATWKKATTVIKKKLSEVTLEDAAWRHPEHYF